MNSKESSEDLLQRARMAMAKKNSGNTTTAKTIVEEIKKEEAAMNDESVDFDTSINETAAAQPAYEGSKVELGSIKNQPAGGGGGPTYHDQVKPATKSVGTVKLDVKAASGGGRAASGGGCCSIV